MLRFSQNGSLAHRRFLASLINCWKCKKASEYDPKNIFCAKCNAIQPVDPKIDYFAYLNVDKKYHVEDTTLRNRFRELQTFVHPDKYGLKNDKEKQLSEQHSSYLNRAYKTLKEPRSRAAYLLELMTNEPAEEKSDDAFAMEIFEFMSEMDELADPKAVKAKAKEIDTKISEILESMEKSFSQKDLPTARSLLNQLRYFDRAKAIIQKKL